MKSLNDLMSTVCYRVVGLKNIPFGIVDGQDFSPTTTQGKLSGIITSVLSDRVWQAPRWIPIPVQNIRDCTASFISTKAGPDDLDQLIRDNEDKHESRNADSGDVGVLNPRFENEGSNAVCNDDCIVVLSRNSKDELVAFVPSRQIVPVTNVPINSNIGLYQGQQRTGETVFRTSPESEFTKTMATS